MIILPPFPFNWKSGTEKKKNIEGMKMKIKHKIKQQLKAFSVERGVCRALSTVCHSDSLENQ